MPDDLYSAVKRVVESGTQYHLWISTGLKSPDGSRIEWYTSGPLAGHVALIVPMVGSVVIL